MTRRRLVAAAVFVVLAVTAGCTGSGIDRSNLDRPADYDWNTSATGAITVSDGEYRAVYSVENGSQVKVFSRDALGTEEPVDIASVKFRYPNETVVNSSAVTVGVEDSRTVITPPAERGKLAYTVSTDPKSVSVPVTVDGSYEVVLPAGLRVGNVLFGEVRPGGYERTVDDAGRTHLRWESLADGDTIVVQSYLQRDLYLFGGLVGLLALLGVGGIVYFRLKIRRLEREREEAGLNVGVETDDSGQPPFR